MANHVYISQSGSGSGASASDPKPVTYFNTASSWSGTPSGVKIGPGTTVHLVGTISTTLATQGAGSSGNPVTILFEQDAKLSAQKWTTGFDKGCALQIRNNWVTVDGGSNGLITATGQGTASKSGSNGVDCRNCNNIVIENLSVKALYVKTSQADAGGSAGANINFKGVSEVTVKNCQSANNGSGIWFGRPGGATIKNLEVHHCHFSDHNWGIGSGDEGSNSVCDGFSIHDNEFVGPGTIWDDPANNANHHNATYVWCSESPGYTGCVLKNFKYYNNYAHGAWGVYSTSSLLFMSCEQGHGSIKDALIYNNVAQCDEGTANGCIVTPTALADTGSYVFNNTLILAKPNNNAIGISANSWSGTQGKTEVSNNIIDGFGNAIYTAQGNPAPLKANNLTTDPGFVNRAGADYHLTSASAARGKASNQSARFTTDKDAVTRPATGSWDIGAYQYTEGGTPPIEPPVQPPIEPPIEPPVTTKPVVTITIEAPPEVEVKIVQ